MLTDSALRELLNYASPDPVLSVYLNTDIVENKPDMGRNNFCPVFLARAQDNAGIRTGIAALGHQ